MAIPQLLQSLNYYNLTATALPYLPLINAKTLNQPQICHKIGKQEVAIDAYMR